MTIKSLRKLSSTTLLCTGLCLPISSKAQLETDSPVLPIDPEEFYSITVKPNNIDGATSYTLKVYADEMETQRLATAVRPLDGQIVDVEIYDFDKDGEKELVIMMEESVSASKKVHFDVFELHGNKLNWINNFAPIEELFQLYIRKQGS